MPVEKPEQMSVKELKAWLSQFGENNRNHYESNQVKKGTYTADFDMYDPFLQ